MCNWHMYTGVEFGYRQWTAHEAVSALQRRSVSRPLLTRGVRLRSHTVFPIEMTSSCQYLLQNINFVTLALRDRR
jgi:hypothetical protein